MTFVQSNELKHVLNIGNDKRSFFEKFTEGGVSRSLFSPNGASRQRPARTSPVHEKNFSMPTAQDSRSFFHDVKTRIKRGTEAACNLTRSTVPCKRAMREPARRAREAAVTVGIVRHRSGFCCFAPRCSLAMPPHASRPTRG